MMSGLEITHVTLPTGVPRLYANYLYALLDEAGELHPPKDAERRELLLPAATENALRVQVLKDVRSMGKKNYPLSAGFWRQLGEEKKAAEVEAMLAEKQTVADHLTQTHAIDCVVAQEADRCAPTLCPPPTRMPPIPCLTIFIPYHTIPYHTIPYLFGY